MTRDHMFADNFVSAVSDIRQDPTVICSWSLKQRQDFLAWLCSKDPENPVYANQDYTVLHCLLRTPPVLIDSPLTAPSGVGVETALSLAVMSENMDLASYLLKMSASPDVLVGWNALLHRPCSYALDCLREENELRWRHLLLEYCKAPCRLSETTPLSYPVDDSKFLEWVKESEIAKFDQGVEFDVSEIIVHPILVQSWNRLHSAFVFSKLVKRRPGGPIAKDFPVMDVILSCEQVSVDDYLVDDCEERVTALHEAVSRKNVPFVRYLLQKHHADPNKRSFIDAMPWNDQTHIVTPLSVSLRGFLVWDDVESKAVQEIGDLLLDAGISEETQIDTIDAIWHDDVMDMMEMQEALHFFRMVGKLVGRQPAIVGHLQRPLSYSIPRLMKTCETKWMKETFDTVSNGRAYLFDSLLREGVALLVNTLDLDDTPITADTLESVVSSRCYRTLAALVSCLGDALPLHMLDFANVELNDVLTEEMVEAGVTLEMAQATDAVRVRALMEICVRSTVAAQKWQPFLAEFYRVTLGENETFPITFFSFRDRCIAGVNDAIRAGFLRRDALDALPSRVQQDVLLDRQFSVLENLAG